MLIDLDCNEGLSSSVRDSALARVSLPFHPSLLIFSLLFSLAFFVTSVGLLQRVCQAYHCAQIQQLNPYNSLSMTSYLLDIN